MDGAADGRVLVKRSGRLVWFEEVKKMHFAWERPDTCVPKSRTGQDEAVQQLVRAVGSMSLAGGAGWGTKRFESTAKVLSKCKLKNYRISECGSASQ